MGVWVFSVGSDGGGGAGIMHLVSYSLLIKSILLLVQFLS